MQVTVDFCLTDGTDTCQNSSSQTVALGYACPPVTIVPAGAGTSAVATWNNQIGATASYNLTVETTTGTQIWTSGQLTSQPPNVSITIPNLTPATNYVAVLTLTVNGVGQTCPGVTFTTAGNACTVVQTDTVATGAFGVGYVYLGRVCFGDAFDTYYYDSGSNQIIKESIAGPCPGGFPNDIQLPINGASAAVIYSPGTLMAGAQDKFIYPDLDCEGTIYTFPAVGVQGCWIYIGQQVIGTTTYYAYTYWDIAGGNAHNGPGAIVYCCECPLSLLGPQTLRSVNGAATNFTLPFISGAVNPTFTITVPPTHGTLTQPNGVNVPDFIYTPNTPNYNGVDTFTIELTDSSGFCVGNDILQYGIYLLGGTSAGNKRLDTSVYSFIDTNTKSLAEATSIKAGLETWYAEYQASCPNNTGNLYIIPVTDSNWVSAYTKAVWDVNASGILAAGPEWNEIKVLPDSWTGAGPATPPDSAWIIAFSDTQAAIPFHPNTLIEGWGFLNTLQPTPEYKTAYVEAYDLKNNTENSAWATAQNLSGTPAFPDGYNLTYYPTTVGTTGSDAAALLMALGALEARMIPPTQWGWNTAVDLTPWLMQGIGILNPYEGAETGVVGLQIDRLLDLNVWAYLDQTSFNVTQLKDDLNSQIIPLEGCGDPVGPSYYTATPCGEPAPVQNIQTAGEHAVGEALKIDGVCHSITGPAEENENIQEVPYENCDTCLADETYYYEIEQCEGDLTTSIQSATALVVGEAVEFEDSCWEVIGGAEENENVAVNTFENCDLCIKALEEAAEEEDEAEDES